MFYRYMDQSEFEKIHVIKELLCVKFGLLSLSSLDVSDCVRFNFLLTFLCVLFVRFYIKYIIILTFNIKHLRK